MDVTKETGFISLTDLPIMVPSNPGVPLRVTPIQFALLVGVDTKESVVELQVLASSVAKLAIYRKIAGRTPLRARLVRLTRSQVLRVVFLLSPRVRLLIPQVPNNPGVPLRVTPIQFALLMDVDTKESVVELQDDKKPGASGRVFAIIEGQAA
nr:hypothetical protein [Tanacetum cinerariifolium]